jgi:tetratricopeptide (TPR) repeat protein
MVLDSSAGSRRMKVFLCHSSGDKPQVRDLYRRLKEDGFQPWLDEVDLIPGQAWRDAIEDTVRSTDAVVVCLSRGSVNKEGYLQKEIRTAVDFADEKPEGAIFLIPTRLEEVDVPRRLKDLQWVNLYETDGYERLVGALQERARKLPVLTNKEIISRSDVNIGRTPPTGFKAVVTWARSHPAFVLTLLMIVLAALVLIALKLQRAQQHYRADAVTLIAEAEQKLKSFDITEAQVLLRQAVTADPDNAVAHANLAVALVEGGNYTHAQREAQIGLALAGSLQLSDRSWVEGVSHETTWQLQEAARFYQEAWAKYKNAGAALRLAHVATLAGKPSESQQVLGVLQESSSATPDPRIDYEKAQAAGALGNLDEEIRVLDQITRDHSSEPLIVATALWSECRAFYLEGKLDKAEPLCKKALELFNDRGYTLGRARVLTGQSLIAAARRPTTPALRQSAMELQNEALDIAQTHDSELDEAGALQNRANLWINRDEYGSALSDYNAASKIYKTIGNQQGLLALENNWAGTLANSCHYEEARPVFESVVEKAGDQTSVATAAANMGWMDYLLGHLPSAQKELAEALKTASDLKLALDPNWLTTLGDVQIAQGKFQLAEECFRGRICSGDAGPLPADWNRQDVLPEAGPEYALLKIEQLNPIEAERIARKRVAEVHGQDPEDEANALDALARSLIAKGALKGNKLLAEASVDVQRAETLDVESCWLRVSLATTAARVSALGGNFPLAEQQITNALREADNRKLTGYKLDALLAQTEIELAQGQLQSANRHASDLKQTADSNGFSLIAQKANNLVHVLAIRSQKQP